MDTDGAAAVQSDVAVSSSTDNVVNLPEKRKRESENETDTKPEAALQQRHPLWKTSLCSYFRSTGGSCHHGDSCRFAHSEEELQPRPDNTWDPTSERAKKMAKVEPKETDDEEGVSIMMTEAFEDGDNSSAGLSKCLVNLPMKWTSDQLRNFLNEKGVVFVSAKKKKGMIVGFVSFESADQVKAATEELNGMCIGNNRTLKVADVLPRSSKKSNKVALPQLPNQTIEDSLRDGDRLVLSESANGNEDDIDDNMTCNDSVLRSRNARAVVTPLADMSYPDQLEHKKNSLAQILKKLTRNARKACPNGVALPEWIQKSRERGGLPCNFEGIIESPVVYGYRNKCEFSVGLSLDGKCTVGFLLGNFREGVTAVEEPVNCPNVSKIACKYATVFQEFLQNSSFPPWNRLNNTGFWRQLTVREGRNPHSNVANSEPDISEFMLIVQVCTVGFEETQIKDEIERLAKAFYVGSTTETPHLPLTALVIQDHTGISNVAPADAHLKYVFIPREGDSELSLADDGAEPRIHDHISSLRFSISPTAFFQVNTLAAEKLYSLAGDWVGLGPETLLFDVCCGTGTIGVTLAHHVGMVVGIEMNASAVADAQRNAEINGIKNCRFVCGKAEDVIGTLMKEYLSLCRNLDNTSNLVESTAHLDEANSSEVDGAPDSENTINGSSDDGIHSGKHNAIGSRGITPQQFKNIVAIVDPPRAGLHPTVIKVLRTQSLLRQLVYISCNPESLVANAIELCTPSRPIDAEKASSNKNGGNRGWRNMSSASLARHRAKSMPNSEPFAPVKAMAVDLFPHTPHCELVMLLER